ncbi:HNH endonuclease [Pelagerythrobacter marinus]|nr:HNH endonuclease [Pelagerythrobacter marinus]
MAKRPLPSPEELRQLLRYEPETGKLFWRERGLEWFQDERSCKSWNSRFANTEALSSPHNAGYLHGNVLSGKQLAHRVIWAIVTGEWPEGDIDHDDGDKSNNRWKNLRPATNAENMQNKKVRRDSSTGLKGVQRHRTGRFTANITAHGTKYYLGLFASLEEAKAAYDAAAIRLHGKYANLG